MDESKAKVTLEPNPSIVPVETGPEAAASGDVTKNIGVVSSKEIGSAEPTKIELRTPIGDLISQLFRRDNDS